MAESTQTSSVDAETSTVSLPSASNTTQSVHSQQSTTQPQAQTLPWGSTKERSTFPENVNIGNSLVPGEFVMQALFAEFTVLADKKIDLVLQNYANNKDSEKPLSKWLQRGEDAQFDQLLTSLNSVAENCLPALLRALFDWYNKQNPTDELGNLLHKHTKRMSGDKDLLCEKRDLAVDFLYCLCLIEVLKQLPYHPGHDNLVTHILSQCFKHFKYKEEVKNSPNAANINMIADLYAEVLGVLAQSRFGSVKKRFMTELKELRGKDQNPFTTNSVISLLMGMKFFRVKMHPIEEFQACIAFLHDLGNYFLEVKDKEIKHALAGLFVEILLPVAGAVKHEVNVPVLKTFVEKMFPPTLDMTTKKKHSLAVFPMVTCLLCVSQKAFFLDQWPIFLTQCLSRLKERDAKMARVALESMYRLVWVYMIRIKCEGNTQTISRLQSIVNSLFPKGQKTMIIPKDAPLNIFVKIIQYIAQERLDFAMREIIYDLLSVGKPIRGFSPERMSIGLRAFLVIADSLQQREGEPPMPLTMGVLPSGCTLRYKKTFIHKYLSEETARTIGVAGYYNHVRKAFDAIMRTLDQQVGKNLLQTKAENKDRDAMEIITGERKPKIDLFRTCVAAIPRLMPDGMSKRDLIELLARNTVHLDDELGKCCFQALGSMMNDLPEWRTDVVYVFIQFVQREVTDMFPALLEICCWRILSLLSAWKAGVQAKLAAKIKAEKSSKEITTEKPELTPDEAAALAQVNIDNRATLHSVEGFALVLLCSCRPIVRKRAVTMLKDVRNLFNILEIPKEGEPVVLDIMDKSCAQIIEKVLPKLPDPEKPEMHVGLINCQWTADDTPRPLNIRTNKIFNKKYTAALQCAPVDFQWLADRTSIILLDLNENNNAGNTESHTEVNFDPWVTCISVFMNTDYVMGQCHTAVSHSWPILYNRVKDLWPHVDPVVFQEQTRSSLLPSRGSKRPPCERDMYMNLWKNYVVMGCCIAPPSSKYEQRSVSPEHSNVSSPGGDSCDHRPAATTASARELYRLLAPQVKCDLADMRETIIIGLGHTNPAAFKEVVDELIPLIKEAIERKKGNKERVKKRDVLRLVLARIFHYMAENGVFAASHTDLIDPRTESLTQSFVEYIEGARLYLETEMDKDPNMLREIRLHFSEFIHHLIRGTPVVKRKRFLKATLRYNLFLLFASWSGKMGYPFAGSEKRHAKEIYYYSELELSAIQSMSAVVTCGPIFDPPSLNEDSKIYLWLNNMLATHHEKIYKLAQETVVWLLEFNPDTQTLLEWVIDRCYTASAEVADGCFTALASVFCHREYSCEHEAMLNLTLLNTGCPRVSVHETAVQMLHLLYKRFFLDDVVHTGDEGEEDPGASQDATLLWHSNQGLSKKQLQDMLLSGPYSRSQYFLSETLARLHPEETMLMFSEITKRIQTCTSSVRQSLLEYLIPWIHNMELCDPNLQNTGQGTHPPESGIHSGFLSPPLKGEGWGSAEATHMILNNLFYMTAKFGDDHPKELEDIWGALVACWQDNLKCVLRYVIIVTGMAPEIVLPHARRVIVYLGRAKPDLLVDSMMNELRIIEPLTFMVERTQTPPFYRLSVKRTQNSSSDEEGFLSDDGASALTGDTDMSSLHTASVPNSTPGSTTGSVHSGHRLRLSHEEPGKLLVALADSTPRTGSAVSIHSEVSAASSNLTTGAGGGNMVPVVDDTSPGIDIATGTGEQKHQEPPLPYPLPMPPYGGYFAPMSELLPNDTGSLPNPPYQRCNLGIMLITDLVVDCTEIDWTVHLPLILHIVFLGMDNTRQLIHEHCKKLLLNLLLVLSAHNDHFSVAKIILGNKNINEDTALTLPVTVNSKDAMFMETSYDSTGSGVGLNTPSTEGTLTPESLENLADVDNYESTEQVAKALIEFLVTRKYQPLWSLEEITSRVHSIRSAEQLEHFLKYVLRIFKESLPLAHIEQRWGQEALHLALNCSSRHYAGRSFQVFRALHVPLTSRDLSEILARLEQTAAENDENMQGYVSEMILTLESAVDNLDVDIRPLLMKEIFMSTPNLNKEPSVPLRKSSTVTPMRQLATPHHFRSTSCNPSHFNTRKSVNSSPPVLDTKSYSATILRRSTTSGIRTRRILSTPPIMEHPKKESLTRQDRSNSLSLWTFNKRGAGRSQRQSLSEGEAKTKDTNLKRSASSQSLKQLQDPNAHEDKLTILTQMFWIAVAMLESDYDYEFLLATKLLTKILENMQPDNCECKEKLEKILKQIEWEGFPGVQALLMKGCTNSLTAESTWQLLSKLTNCVKSDVIASEDSDGFAMNVIALLPYLVEHYEEPTQFCTEAAERIAQVCKDLDELENLKHMMELYTHGTFGKDSYQWTKCVIKYVYDVYTDVGDAVIPFLVEVLDKGPNSTQAAILEIIFCIVQYLDKDQTPLSINTEVLRVVARSIETPHWKESLRILKLCVARSSILTEAPSGFNTSLELSFPTAFNGDISKKQLPGRTMEFKFDMNQIPVIGYKKLEIPYQELPTQDRPKEVEFENGYVTSWDKPRFCQDRVRHRLRKLLDYYDPTPRAHKLQNSSSVTFPFEDSPGNTLERQFSINNASNPSDGGSVIDTQTGTDPSEPVTGDDSSVSKALQSFHFLEEEDYTSIAYFGVRSYESSNYEGSIDQRDEDYVNDTDSSDDEPTETVDLHKDLATVSTFTLENPQLDYERHRNLSGSTQHSVLHTDTEDEGTDLSPSNPSPLCESPYPGAAAQRGPIIDEMEAEWKEHISAVMQETTPDNAQRTFHLFNRLFQDISIKLSALTTESCILLKNKPMHINNLSTKFTQLLELLTSRLICPFVFVDMEALTVCEFLRKHKICYAEIEQTYDTYIKKRRDTVECLSHVRVSSKHPSPSESPGEHWDRMKMQLCQSLYALHFQFLQLFESYLKLVRKLEQQPPQVIILSGEVNHLKQELKRAQSDMDHEPDPSLAAKYGSGHVTLPDGEHLLMEKIGTTNFHAALDCVKIFRSSILEDTHYYDDVDVLLYVYCKNKAEIKPGMLAITDRNLDSSEVKQCLMEVYTLLKQVENLPRATEFQDVGFSVKSVDSSIL